MSPFPLVLASASPRRKELLERLGLRPEVRPSHIQELQGPDERPRDFSLRMAREKARAGLTETGGWVLAADTVVVLDGDTMGKPEDHKAARGMLERLSGRSHTVLTATCLLDGSGAELSARVVETTVSFRVLSSAELAAYLNSGEWRGKAGAYAIQGIAAMFVESIEGSYTNVVGLPLAEVVMDLYDASVVALLPLLDAASSSPEETLR